MTPTDEVLRATPEMIGESAPFLALMERVSRAAVLERPALVVGERGTGKEALAARLHYLSERWQGPLVKVNCAALPDTLLDSELFGHEAGAFTGATRRRAGRFEQAHGGTLLLDEIANASAQTQEKILRAVEYGEVQRVGADAVLRVDVRVIGSTNVDLPEAARAGRFRRDLLDRLAFEVLTVPPLRARREDIVLLAEHFARAFAVESGLGPFSGFGEAALGALRGFSWPGNVRELKNVVERAMHRHAPRTDRIDAVEFDPFDSPYRPVPARMPPAAAPQDGHERPADGGFRTRVGAFERGLLRAALADAHGNQRRAARALELSYDQFRHQLRRHGIRPSPRAERGRTAP